MFAEIRDHLSRVKWRLMLPIALIGCLGWIALTFFRRTCPDATARRVETVSQSSTGRVAAAQTLDGENARAYLEQTSEGESLMQAVTAARFGLKLEERDPISGKSGPGYLGMSHDQNLNAWFDDTGATIRPTAPTPSWKLGFRLRGYGYGKQLIEAPPIVSRQVKGSRIEYVRTDCQLPIANCRFEEVMSAFGNPRSSSERLRKMDSASSSKLFQSAIGNRQSAMTEWYENRSEGIEQGFTINERPARSGVVAADEPLRVALGVTGDLRAIGKDGGQRIELVDAKGRSAISYGKLTAVDANNKQLAARMETTNDGREIVLVVADQSAAYPIVIDPIVASQEAQLNGTQVDSRFGFAVAIDGDRAVVGAWREDYQSSPDNGVAYFFSRVGSTWSQERTITNVLGANSACGWSVAISGNRSVVGCPGAYNQTGEVFTPVVGGVGITNLKSATPGLNPGDQFGYSVAISGADVVVGAPFHDENSLPDTGKVYTFIVNSDGSVSAKDSIFFDSPEGAYYQLGTAVAIDGDVGMVGMPGYSKPGPGAGLAMGFTLNPTTRFFSSYTFLRASDRNAGDHFGDSVAISGNKAVIGAWGDDDGGADSGAAYVFVRDANGAWSQQQKIKAPGGRAGDHFSEHAVAIEGNTIVVGATGWDFLPDDNAGAVYIFTPTNTAWTQQTRLDGASAYNYGIAVDISGNNADQQFFVRQHFYDFLSRSPDPGGFGFWVGQITQCGNNQTCLNNKRLDVSNAFFFELEYQQTGAYVFRLYRAAFGNNQPFPNPDTSNSVESKKLPAYAVFAPDRARVVGGASLAIGQQSIANAFVQRGAFLARYPSQDGPTFVVAVLATILNDTGVNLTSQRTALINLFNFGGRGAVMYRLANDDAQGGNGGVDNHLFIDEEYNRAFVATQYFGYLRRDADIGGFLFWLGQVNSAPQHDTTKQHAMVCAFITAAEYQQRFSPVVTHSNGECAP